ncbi:MAG: right-handed parallel beta-helix repeat-containing protein [Candidatus Bathyarchaeia archaeon]|jgi:hypothetical protein
MMRQTQLVGHKVTAHVLLFVLSVLLISTIVIVSVLSYSSITRLQDAQTALQQKYDGLYLQYENLSSTCSALEVNDSNLRSLYANLQSQVLGLGSNISSLQSGYASLQSQYASLMENYSKLVSDYNDYLAKMPLVTDSSFYILKQNNTYYAKSGLTGEIEIQDENCSLVINYALTHVPYGGAVFFEPLASADDAYYIDSTIYPLNGTTLASENRVVTICLNSDSNKDVIDLYNVHDVQISNINIYGNRWNGTTGNGIVIDSNSSYGSNDLIENVVIDDCNGTGIWVRQYPVNNAFRNVEVFHSGAYNIEVDSADNQFIDVESGWAGYSGFDVSGVDNYFSNCISWGCGYPAPLDQADRNGFSISGARNMFVGCDADRNGRGGFVLAYANQTMLASCVGRNNGQNVSGWGFDLYNSIGTVMSACVATDEQTPKTQDYAFTEGGSSDFNTVTGCNFDGNKVGAVFALVGMHSVITDTVGYETKNFGYVNFRYSEELIAIGTNDTYGALENFTSNTGTIVDFHVTIKWNNTADDENVTVRVQALMLNGTTTSFEISRNGNSIKNDSSLATFILTDENASELWSNNDVIQGILISARTTENMTTAAVSVYVWGSGS